MSYIYIIYIYIDHFVYIIVFYHYRMQIILIILYHCKINGMM